MDPCNATAQLLVTQLLRKPLWGGDYPTIERSIRQRLHTLDEEAIVVTWHGDDTVLCDKCVVIHLYVLKNFFKEKHSNLYTMKQLHLT